MDGTLVIVSLFDTIISVIFGQTSKIFDILRVFRLVRALRPLRVINRAPGLKLVVQTLLSSLKPIGNIVLICCTFFIIFGILGVQVLYGSWKLVMHNCYLNPVNFSKIQKIGIGASFIPIVYSESCYLKGVGGSVWVLHPLCTKFVDDTKI